eukprot:2439622-Rhodomonas_salina.1
MPGTELAYHATLWRTERAYHCSAPLVLTHSGVCGYSILHTELERMTLPDLERTSVPGAAPLHHEAP